MIHLHRQSPPECPRRGFTLIELLVAVSLIIILISLIIVALNQSQKTAQRINTQVLMNSLSQAVTQFREDTGYLPPILDQDRALIAPPSINLAGPAYRTAIQDWFSVTSLAEFLIGYDSGPNDGFGAKIDPSDPNAIEVNPFPGIRHPGPDGIWGAGAGGSVALRNPPTEGNVLGPYLQLDNPRLLASIDYSTPIPRVLYPGDAGYNDPANPKVIVDAWGNPIRYYRKAYPDRALSQSYRPNVDRDASGTIDPIELRIPTLSDVILLRPQQINEASAVPGGDTFFYGNEPFNANDITSYELQTADFAFFSPGSDRGFNAMLRFDDPKDPDNSLGTELLNADNIVEIGK